MRLGLRIARSRWSATAIDGTGMIGGPVAPSHLIQKCDQSLGIGKGPLLTTVGVFQGGSPTASLFFWRFGPDVKEEKMVVHDRMRCYR